MTGHIDWVALSAAEPHKQWPACLAMVEKIYAQVDCVDAPLVLQPRRLIKLLAGRPKANRMAALVFWFLVSAYEGCRQMVLETLPPCRWSAEASLQALDHCDFWVQRLLRSPFVARNVESLSDEMHALLCYDVNTQMFRLKPLPLDGEAITNKRKEQRQHEQQALQQDMQQFDEDTKQSLLERSTPAVDPQSQFFIGCFVDIAEMLHSAFKKSAQK